MSVIANTTIISNFAAAGQIELLQTLWSRLYISTQVYDEIQAGLLYGYTFYAHIVEQIFPFSETGWLYLTALQSSQEFQLYGELLSRLHSGEASCLSIAHRRQWTFLSDDRTARQVSAELNVPFSGSLGILLALVRWGVLPLTKADTVLKQMIQSGYYSPVTSLSQILSE